MTRTIEDLATPCVLVDEGRMSANLRRMQEKADAWQAALRPHVKTHKSPSLAREQIRSGASGITVATVDEAEIFASAGFDDVCIAYTLIGREKLARVVAAASKCRISFCVDSEIGARQASEFLIARDRVARVLVEIDTGHGRCGLPWDDLSAVDFLRFVSSLPGLQVLGLLTHGGHAYEGPHEGEQPVEALRRVAAEERDRILDVAWRLQEAGLLSQPDVDWAAGTIGRVVSVGSTPTMAGFQQITRHGLRVTEIRPGNYIFNDSMQVGLGSAALADCALTVQATVVSKHRERSGRERVIIDAGKKVLTSDRGYGTDGYGLVLYNATTMTPLPHARLAALSEEHGWIEVSGGSTLDVGDRVRVVPNHACVVAATQRQLHLVRGEDVVGGAPVGR